MSEQTVGAAEFEGRSRDRRHWLALAGLTGPIVFYTVVTILGLVTPGYSAVSDPISNLGAVGAPYAIVQQLNFVLLGLSILAFAVGMDREFRDGWRPWVGILLIGVLGLLGAIGSGIFQSNPSNPEATTEMLHGLSVSLGFMAGIVGISLTAWRLSTEERWPGYRSLLTVFGTVVVLFGSFAFFLFLMLNDSVYAGLGQRLFTGVVTGWVAYHSYKLYKLPTAG